MSLIRVYPWAAAGLLLCLTVSAPLSAQSSPPPVAGGGQGGGAPPDLIFYNGKIVTVDEQFRLGQAFSVTKNVFAQVGADAEILKTSGPATRKIDLKGRTVIPGLIDNHNHQLSLAVREFQVEVQGVGSREQMLAAISDKASRAAAGEMVYVASDWLTDVSFDRADWLTDATMLASAASVLDRGSLDRAAPRNPVIADGGGPHGGGHHMYLNSAALSLAGINRDTPSPAGGLIQKDPKTGEPTGLLIENARTLAQTLIPRTSHEERVAAIETAQRKQNSVGLTGIREPGLTPEEMRAYSELWARKAMTLRVSMNLDLDPQRSTAELIQQLEQWGVASGFGDPWLRLDGIGEFSIDGGFESGLMSARYRELGGAPAPAGYVGVQRIDTEKFEQVTQAMARLNWRGSVHVVGDAGMDRVLAAFTKANAVKGIEPRRWVLEHCHYTRTDQLAAIKNLGLSISTQFHPYIASEIMIRNWGAERAAQAMRVRDWLDAGIRVSGGSDYILVPSNPFWMIHFWVTRETRAGKVIGPEQRVSRAEALRMMTINNAYLTFEDDIKGSIEAGKLADFVILSDDILNVPASRIKDLQALATVVDGKLVYSSAGNEFPDFEKNQGRMNEHPSSAQ